MSGIRVVTKTDCPFCTMAKSWLKEHAFEYEEELIDNEEERLAFYQTINGATEVVGENNTSVELILFLKSSLMTNISVGMMT